MRIKVLIVVFCLVGLNLYAQSSLNGYKYVIIPKKFDFQKAEDKYQLNSLTKFLFNKEGFTTLFDGDKTPQDLYENPCLGLKAEIKDKSKMFSIKVIIELLDCRNAVVFTSMEGRSKEKEYKRGYQEGIRRAFESIKAFDYKYDATLAAATQPKMGIPKQIRDNQLKPEAVIESKPEIEEAKSVEEQVENIKTVEEDVIETVKNKISILYAQAKPFGYQLVDSAPRVVYLLQKTSIKDLFILKSKNGIIHKKNEKWVVEYYESNQLIKKELNIKF